MKKEDFAKTRAELEEQKKQIEKQIYENDKKVSLVNANQIEYKASMTFAFSVIGYMVLVGVLALSKHFFNVEAITSSFFGFGYPIALLGGTLGLGTIARVFVEKKSRLKERLKAFSSAKKQVDLLEEEIKYQIELEKVNNRKQVIERVESILKSQEEALERLSNKYNIYEKDTPQTEEEAKQKIVGLSNLISENYEELDLRGIQKVLHDRFSQIRIKWRKLDRVVSSWLSGLLGGMLFTTAPIVMKGVSEVSFAVSNLIMLFTSMVVGSSVAVGYAIKRNKDYSKVFHRFNSKLGNYSLKETIQDTDLESEAQNLKALIQNKTSNISVAIVELKEQQRALEALKIECLKQQEAESKKLEQVVPCYTEDKIRIYEQEPPALMPTELNFGQSEVSDETQLSTSEEKGPTLIKKKNINKI